MAMVCAPPRRAIKARGAVIVNVHSQYILMRPRTIDTRRRDKEREKRRTAWQSFRGKNKVTRDLVDEDRANNPASYRSLVVSLRIVNRRCQEIRERFEARLLKHPSFGCDRGLSYTSYNYEYARLYVFGHSTPYVWISTFDRSFSYSHADVLRKLFVSLCTSWHLYHVNFYKFIPRVVTFVERISNNCTL